MAQQTVSGEVTDPSGSGLPGVTIVEKGTSNGTVTDVEGRYSLSVSQNASLIFSYVGYQSTEIVVNNRSTVNVQLEEDITHLSEIVVVGYGTQERRDVTGSVASVKSEDFNKGVMASPDQLFQGKMSGVQVTSNSGEPGSGVNIRIRGTSSVRSGNGPLFVVDGIPLTSADIASGGVDIGRGTSAASNPLNFLNPNDIASIDVLKDASATAIYGSRGANGVIMITTKSGKGAASEISYSASLSFSSLRSKLDLLGADEFLDGAVKLGALRSEIDYGHKTDWQDEVFKTGVSHNHDIAFANSYKSGDYRVSVAYGSQGGIIQNSALDRLSSRINWNHRLLEDKLTLGLQATFSNVNNQQLPLTDDAGFEGDLLAATYMANPTWAADPANQPTSTNLNPLSYIEYTQDNTITNRGLINISAEYQLAKGFTVKANTGFDRANAVREAAYSGDLNMGSNSVSGNGIAALSDFDTESDLFEGFFNYNTSLSNSEISAVLGYSYQQFRRAGVKNQGWGFNTTNMDGMISILYDAIDVINNSVSGSYQQWGYDMDGNPDDDIFFINRLFPTPSTDINNDFSGPSNVRSVTKDIFEEVDELQSVFFRLNYSIQDKYLLTGTVRADGSSRFGENNLYGIFPSFAAAWRLSDENFVPDLFQDLKLRAGWGITGNQEIPHNVHQARQRYGEISIGDGGQVGRPSLGQISFQAPDLQWEQTIQANVGIDFGFFNGRLNGTVDYYNKNTTNLLMKLNSAQPAPQAFTWENLDAEVINKGLEVALNYTILSKTELTWDISGNYSYNDNVVEGLSSGINTGRIHGQGLSGAFAQRIANGEPLYAYYLRVFGGFDENGNSIYPEGDVQKFIGKSPLPNTNVGFSTNLTYKNWNFAVYGYGQYGHYVYNNTQNALFTAGSLGNGRNVTRDVLTSGESNLNAPDVSTRFLEKGDFFRIQNFSVAYKFDTENLGFLKQLNVSAVAQNLFLFSDYSGFDPEVNSNKAIDDVPSFGIEYSPYPRPRTFTIGISARF